MEKSFSILENRQKSVEDMLEVLLELDQILYKPDGLPYVLERHEQMQRKIASAREEIAFLTEEIALAEAKRQRRQERVEQAARRLQRRRERNRGLN